MVDGLAIGERYWPRPNSRVTRSHLIYHLVKPPQNPRAANLKSYTTRPQSYTTRPRPTGFRRFSCRKICRESPNYRDVPRCPIAITVSPARHYRVATGRRWPVEVRPAPGELLSSWLHRLAYANGVPPRYFGAVLGAAGENWSAQLDRHLPDAVRKPSPRAVFLS